VTRKIVLIVAALVFATGILAASVFKTSAQTVTQAVEVESLEMEIEVVDEATPAMEEKVDYALTWPGILPDHFLYPLKMIRDRIWLSLTTNVLKKAETLLKLADKRIWSAQMLLDKGKEELAVTTATKAEKYFERAVDQAAVAEEKGQDISSLKDRLSLAALKHQETLREMREKASDSTKLVIDGMLERAGEWVKD